MFKFPLKLLELAGYLLYFITEINKSNMPPSCLTKKKVATKCKTCKYIIYILFQNSISSRRVLFSSYQKG